MANNQLLASDNFASGSFAAGWSAAFGDTLATITGTPFVCEPGGLNATYGQQRSSFASADQTSEFAINLTNEVNTYGILYVRLQSGVSGGYQLNIGNAGSFPAAILYAIGNGTPIFTSGALTLAAGDIWSLQAVGACLSIYQNFKLIGSVFDTTFTSGVPGFAQYTATSAAHTQVLSWRGYNAVQQDGVWSKQGVVFPALSGDLSLGDQNCCIIQDTNAQILSGTVYKMWFMANQSLAYAESLTGLPGSWTRYVSYPAITNACFCATVMKVGSTYHLYGQPVGVYNIWHYTSTDGVNWTGGTQIFTTGAGGQWDDGFVYYFTPVYIDGGGTWYAYYTAAHLSGGAATSTLSTGLATSTDGVTWTRHVGNPVITNFWGVTKVTKIDSTFYTWGQINNPGQGSGQPFVDPAEAARMQSTDLITWTNRVHSAHHSQQFENVNGVKGGHYPSFVMDINGKAYQYASASPDDADGGGAFQLTLAIAPVPIAQLVTGNEDAVAQVASDAFEGGAGSLSSNWTTPTGGTALQIVSGPYVEPTVLSTDCQAVYTGASFSPNQYSELTTHALSGGFFASTLSLLVRASSGALTGYEARIGSNGGASGVVAYLYKRVAGSAVQIGPGATVTPTATDVWRLAVVTGSDGFPTLSLFQNGFLVLQVQDQSASPITSGNPGILAEAASAIANAQISLWAGGNANVIPNYPSSGARSVVCVI